MSEAKASCADAYINRLEGYRHGERMEVLEILFWSEYKIQKKIKIKSQTSHGRSLKD